MTRIAFAYDVPYPWHIGGIEAMNFNEAEELAKEHDVHYFTMKWPGMRSNEFVYRGIKYHAYNEASQEKIYRHGRRSIREAAKYVLSLAQIYRHRFDVVITNAFPILHLPFLKLYCKMHNAKLIVQVAEAWDRDYWRRYIGGIGGLSYSYSRNAIKGADMYVTISSTTTMALMKLGIPRQKIREFAPAVDDSVIRRVNSERIKRSRTVLFSGRLIKEKRLDLWLRVLAAAARRDGRIRGLIIGSGPDMYNIERQIWSLGMKDRVSFHNYYSDSARLYRQIRKSMAILHMSEREGLGILAIEGIMLNTPVLLPDYSPIPSEVKGMCITGSDKKLEDALVSISAGIMPQPKADMHVLARFAKSHVREFYAKLFMKIGAGGK